MELGRKSLEVDEVAPANHGANGSLHISLALGFSGKKGCSLDFKTCDCPSCNFIVSIEGFAPLVSDRALLVVQPDCVSLSREFVQLATNR